MADRSVKVVVSANVQGLVAGFQTAKKATADYANSAIGYYEKNQQALNEIADTSLKVGAGLTALAGFAVKSAMDWEQAWTGVLKTVDGTPQQLAAVEDGLRELAVTTGFTHTEVAAVAEAAGQLGISTGGITKFTETMLAMGVSTNLSSEEAATGLARLRNIMGSSESEISNIGSTIVALGNNFATTEGEILEMSLRLAGAGRQAGLTEADVLGIAASMSSVGIEAEAGGTAMSMVLKRIGKEVESSGPKLDLFAQTAGMTATQFQSAWEQDAAGALTTFVAGLNDAESMGMSTNAVLAELGITGIREADALLRLSGNAEGLADSLGMAADGWRQNIALQSEADKFYGTTAQKGKQAWAAIKDAGIDAGDALLPVVATLAEGIAGIAGAFGALPGPVKGGVTAIAGITGVSLLAFGALVKLAGAITSVTTTVADLNASTSAGARGLGFLASSAGRAGLAVGGLAIANSVIESIEKRNPADIRKLSRELERLGASGKAGKELQDVFGKGLGGEGRLFRDVKSLGEALGQYEKYADDNFLTRTARRPVDLGVGGDLRRQVETIKDMDAALAQLSRSKPDDAIKSFERLRDVAIEQGASVEDISAAFPSMTQILQSASESMGGTADAAEILNGSLEDLAPTAQQSAEELQKAEERARGIGEQFLAFGDSLSDSKVSLADWTASLQEQADALKDFANNAIEAARRGLDEGLIQSLEDAGPAGAMRLAQLADASESEIARANKAFQSGQEAIALFVAQATNVPYDIVSEFKVAGAPDAIATAAEVARKYELTPDVVETILRALDYSSDEIRAVQDRLNGLDGQSATIGLFASGNALSQMQSVANLAAGLAGMNPIMIGLGISGQNAIGGYYDEGVRAYANGGIDAGGRSVARAPQMRSGAQGTVMWGEPETGWEAYISGKPGMEDRNRNILAIAAGRLGMAVTKYADGGFTEAAGRLDTLRMRIRVRDLQRSLREMEEYGEPDKKTKKRKKRLRLRGMDRTEAQYELSEARRELAATLRANSAARRRGMGPERYNEYRQNQIDTRQQFAEDRRSASQSFAGNGDLSTLRSPAAVQRSLAKSISDMATFTKLLIALKKKGAAPWLLGQLQAAGPTREAIRLAEQYLADSAALASVNAQAKQLDAVSSIYGQVTSSKQWTSPKSWSGGLSAAQSRTLELNINTIDRSVLSNEIRRVVTHEVMPMLGTGAGV